MKIIKQKLTENKVDSIVEETDVVETEATEEIPSIDDISSAAINDIATGIKAFKFSKSDVISISIIDIATGISVGTNAEIPSTSV